MKKILIVFALLFSSYYSNAQFGVSIHQSNLPFFGLNYGIGDLFLPELRVGTDNFFEDTSVELCILYNFAQTDVVDAYSGFGGRLNLLEGIVLPAGLNIYPFNNKAFGFHMELSAIFLTDSGEDGTILRGSWGIRYRFVE